MMNFFKKREIRLFQKPDKELSPEELDYLICPNCGETESGRYCPNCGQSNKDYNKPIKEIFGDLAESINLDIRMINTLGPFFIKPGFLTHEYFRGRRKRYVPPMRMYLIMSLIFFFILERNSIRESRAMESSGEIADTTDILSKMTYSYDDTTFAISSAEEEEIRETLKRDSLSGTVVEKIVLGGIKAQNNKEQFMSQLRKNISYLFFVLMPIFALLLMLIHRKSKMLYIKHLIFSINFHSFAFGIFIIIQLIQSLAPDTVFENISYLHFGVPIYLLFGMKNFYNRSYLRSFAKTLGILSLYSFVVGMSLLAGLVLTVLWF